jgi:cyclophilin family peptidyl-prolyl cis-trans isomerase
MRTLLRSLSVILLLSCPGLADADLASATAAMENPANPLLLMRTSRGDIYLELFPQSAPRNVANVIALAEARVPLFDITTGMPVTPHYYDGVLFHRILRNYLVQTGAPRSASAPVPEYQVEDEINARQFGLHEEKVLDPFGKPHPWLNLASREDFEREILVPLYRRMGISSPEAVEARQFEIHDALRAMTLREAYENLGYRYNDRLESRAPLRGSVAMASDGPGANAAEFFITLVDAPWLAGRATVIGRVVEGMEVVDRIDQAAVLRGDTTSATPTTATMIFDLRQVNALPQPGN